MTERNGSMFKQIVCGVVIVLVAGWIGYISLKGTTLDAIAAGLNTRVTVLETITSTIKEDISDIKTMIKEVRDDRRKENRERK